MQKYVLRGSSGERSLELTDISQPLSPGPDEVVVKVHAASLNYRELLIAGGAYPIGILDDVIPASDGAGDVIAVGANVTEFKPGDRVLSCFFPMWDSGYPTLAKAQISMGGSMHGMLAEQVVLPATAFMHLPAELDYAEGATLPCAALTAWNALVEIARTKAGDTVLLQGTGGVSTFALQFAKSMGATVIQTSSSDEKLASAKAMGADHLINYREKPEWDVVARELTDGEGVDTVIEVGGSGTLERSLRATRMGGTVATIGLVTGLGQIDPLPIIGGMVKLVGFMVGSREMQSDMLRAIVVNGIKPMITQRFSFADAPRAFAAMREGVHGKLVIEMNG